MAYLNQLLSQFSGMTTATPQYIFPTAQNLSAGVYISEILDVKEIVSSDGNLTALDFYQKLSGSNGCDIYVRFRYYAQELPALAKEFSEYPSVKTWQNTVGLREQVTVSPKTTGNYMHISARNASNVTATGGTSSQNPSPRKKSGGISPRRPLGSKTGSKHHSLINDDEWDNDDLFDEDE